MAYSSPNLRKSARKELRDAGRRGFREEVGGEAEHRESLELWRSDVLDGRAADDALDCDFKSIGADIACTHLDGTSPETDGCGTGMLG